MTKHLKVKTTQIGDRLTILNGVDPIRYVDLTKNKVVQYKPKVSWGTTVLGRIRGMK